MPSTTTLSPSLARFDAAVAHDLDRALELEWLETDGLGGYATSTIVHCPTRRYHGLFVSAPPGRVDRHVFLSRYEEEASLVGSSTSTALSVACYGDTWAPQGHLSIESFELAPYPRSVHVVGNADSGCRVTREVLLVRGAAISLCRWSVDGPEAVDLRLRPFFPCRPADALTVANDVLDATVEQGPQSLSVRPYEVLPRVFLAWDGPEAKLQEEPLWYRGLHYAADEARGYSGGEDQWTPGVLSVRLEPGEAIVIAASLTVPVDDPASLWEVESEVRREELGAAGDLFDRTSLAADAFVYRDAAERLGVIAGYPWFGEWGRDTFIALPGLTLARGRFDDCAEALEGAVAWMRGGLLPNVFGATIDESHYGSADAALWFARAVWLYDQATHDSKRMRELFYPALVKLAEAYFQGTQVGLVVDDAGCLFSGDETKNLTWMDANTEDGAVTPRHGCAVELNALWYSLLAHLEDLAGAAGERAQRKRWTDARRLLRRSFLERFWLADEGYLADRWVDGEPDRAVRPNMVLAAALEKSPLTRAQRRGVVERATRDLLTPRGLRTLAADHPDYIGRYAGSPLERDTAYHQGTVWPWLLGFYVEARLRAEGDRRPLKEELTKLWEAIDAETARAGLGHVSEVFGGDAPHPPGGTIAQAWNTAECLRSLALLRAPVR